MPFSRETVLNWNNSYQLFPSQVLHTPICSCGYTLRNFIRVILKSPTWYSCSQLEETSKICLRSVNDTAMICGLDNIILIGGCATSARVAILSAHGDFIVSCLCSQICLIFIPIISYVPWLLSEDSPSSLLGIIHESHFLQGHSVQAKWALFHGHSPIEGIIFLISLLHDYVYFDTCDWDTR